MSETDAPKAYINVPIAHIYGGNVSVRDDKGFAQTYKQARAQAVSANNWYNRLPNRRYSEYRLAYEVGV